MRIFVMGIILIVNLVLQSTIFGYIEIMSIKPNTAILIIVSYAILRGDSEGAVFGFFTGLLQDMFFGQVVGLYAMLGLLTGYFCGKPFKDFYKESYLLPMFLAGISCILYEVAFYVIFFLFKGKLDLVYYFGRVILPEAVYTLILTLPVYRLLFVINSALENHEKYNRKLF